MIRCVALAPAVDVTYQLADGTPLAVGGINRPVGVHRRAGGKGVNVARAVTGLGGEATVAAIVGGDTGRWFAALAAEERMSVDLIDAGRAETRLCVTVLDRPGVPTDIYEVGVPVEAGAWDALAAAASAVDADWTVVSGSVPRGVGADALADLVAQSAARRPVALDAHGPAVATSLAAGMPLSVLKVNRSEAAELVCRSPMDDPAELCQDLATRVEGALVVVTDGARGAVALEPGGSTWQVAPGPLGAFPTGSGDAFVAGLVLALDEGREVVDALRRGAAAAAANAQNVSAGSVRPEQAAEAYAALADAVTSAG